MLTGLRQLESNNFIFKTISGPSGSRTRQSFIGLGGQEVHLVLGGDADDFRDIRQLVKLIEQRFEFLRRRHPEQRPRRLVRLVEIAVRNAAGQPNQIAGLGLHPNPIQFQVQHAILYQDEFVLGGMNMDGDKLAGIAVGLESEGGVRHCLGEINLTKNIPGLAGISRSVARDAFFEGCHDIRPPAGQPDATCGAPSVKQAHPHWTDRELISCKSLKSKIYASLALMTSFGEARACLDCSVPRMRLSTEAGEASAARSQPRLRAQAQRSRCSAAIARRSTTPLPRAPRTSQALPMSRIRPPSAPRLRRPRRGSRLIC